MKPSGEAELVGHCRKGDPEAWDELFNRHYAPTGRFIFQLSPDLSREDAEEICQEVFLSVVKNLASFQGGSQLQTWIFRIAVNKARDFRERQHASKRGGGRSPISLHAAHDAEHGLAVDPPSPNPGPDALAAAGDENALIRDALERLGEPCREIIELRYFGDLSYEEIGRALRLNEKTVSSRLSKCLDRLELMARPIFGSGKGKWERTAPSSV